MESNKVRAVILANEIAGDHHLWVQACESYCEFVSYRVINLTKDNWLEAIQEDPFDVLLAKPAGLTTAYKQLYDERIYILGKVLDYLVYPSVEEILLHENKRFLSSWLQANKIPHPMTHVFYDQNEAMSHIESARLPIVAKTNIGASGSGVRILNERIEAEAYIKRSFSGKGAARRIGPNLSKNNWIKRGFHYVQHPGDIKHKIGIYKALRADTQTGFVILQEFVPHEFEWRVVRIGNSFFAHKKLKTGQKASGSLRKGYGNPPLNILGFVKEITDQHDLFSQAVDIFESKRGYLINEMQCIFGQSDPYQMLVDGKPGRYFFNGEGWIFEEGDFNGNESFNLRVQYITEYIKKSNKKV